MIITFMANDMKGTTTLRYKIMKNFNNFKFEIIYENVFLFIILKLLIGI